MYCLSADAGKAGVGKDAASATRMSLDEAQKVLGISKDAPLEEVLKVLQRLIRSIPQPVAA